MIDFTPAFLLGTIFGSLFFAALIIRAWIIAWDSLCEITERTKISKIATRKTGLSIVKDIANCQCPSCGAGVRVDETTRGFPESTTRTTVIKIKCGACGKSSVCVIEWEQLEMESGKAQ